MPHWFEVFDNEQVQFLTRQQVAMLTAMVVGTTAFTISVLALGHVQLIPMPLALVLLFTAWLGTIRYLSTRLRRLRRVVWCVKISDRCVVGYDYTRRKTTMDWLDVARVELTSDGLVLAGTGELFFEVPHLFPDFAELSHRIVHYAESYGVPVFINGQPWQQLDVYDCFPFLKENASPDRPDALQR